MGAIGKNLLIMVLTVVILLGGCYLLLVLLDVWLKFKSGSREQDGLADLLVSARIDASKQQDLVKRDSGEGLKQDDDSSDSSS